MVRTGREKQTERQQVTLHLGASPVEAWENVLLPWFQAAAPVSWQQEKPTLVVVPFRNYANVIKGRLLDAGVSTLGIRFVSPPELRELLITGNGTHLPLREHLRLILAIAAEECMTLPENPALREKRITEPDFLAAKSVARAPDHFLRTIDQLGAAGWNFSAVDLPALRQIESRFQKLVAQCGFELIHTADRRAVTNAEKADPVFANVLVAGFNAAHWPVWQLLRAGVSASEQATVWLEDPSDEARDLDETWIGTWEETFGEAESIAPARKSSGDSLFTEAEMRGKAVAPAKTSFIVGLDITEQAEAVALTCIRFLSEENCTRVGVLFAGPGSLARLVASNLSKLGVPHNDGLGHPLPQLFQSPEWHAWLQLQRSPRVNSLVGFLSALPDRERIFPGLTVRDFERTLRAAHADVLIDDLTVLQKFCVGDATGKGREIAQALERIQFLPARASLPTFLSAVERAFSRLGWKQHWTEIASRGRDWARKIDAEFSQNLFLRWLEEIGSSFGIERDAVGDHPYARVHLLPLPQAHGREWSHLIFAGFNEGSWPPPERGEFAREEEIEKFNRDIRQLNRRSTKQGRQGEGHTSVRENFSLYLGPAEQRAIALRQFQNLFQSATAGAAFSASLLQDNAPERLWNPNEIFTRLYQAAHASPLTQSAMTRLKDATQQWLKGNRDLTSVKVATSKEVGQTRLAYDARRDPGTRSAEYDFAFRSSPPSVPILSVSDFEKTLSAPALVWLKKYLGVQAGEDDTNVWNTSSGRWVHDWLAAIAAGEQKTFTRFPDLPEIERRICAAAEAKRSQVTRLCQLAGKVLPDWWIGGWRNAVFLARALGEKLGTVRDWPWMTTEWKIEDDLVIPVKEDSALHVRGRIDLVLAREQPTQGSLATAELWIIDYKTGAKKALIAGSPDAAGHRPTLKKKLLDGSALQLGLYSLAAGTLGAGHTEVSLLSLLVRPLQPQVSGSDFTSEADVFAELAEMQRTGVFGMHGPLRSAFRFVEDYPLATVAIDPDILEQRWERTHPALVRDEEDIFW